MAATFNSPIKFIVEMKFKKITKSQLKPTRGDLSSHPTHWLKKV